MDYNKIVKEFGTPSYVFDMDELEKRVHYLEKKLSNGKLCFAVKANTFLIPKLSKLVHSFEVCSPGEYYICEDNNVSPNMLVISGVNKEEHFIDYLIKNKDIGIFTVESPNQLALLDKISIKYGKKINVIVRLTSGNQFGVSKSELLDIFKNHEDYKFIHFKGIEFFSGTQKVSLKKLERELSKLKDVVDTIESEYNYEIEMVEFGPGLPVHYYIDEEFDEDEFLTELNNLIQEYLGNKFVTLEIGRSIAASCGAYLTSVCDMKKNKVGNFAIMDGGIHHIAYYGQTMAMKIPHYEILPKKDSNYETWSLCGSLCTINDFLVKQISVPSLELGDTFVFKNAGAYCVTEGISLFLSRDLPKVIIHEKDDNILVRDIISTYHFNMIKKGN